MDDRKNNSKTLRHYPSTPQLETFRVVNRSASSVTPSDNYLSTPIKNNPVMMSSFSTFANNNNNHLHHKSGNDMRYRDDPNPYKVSEIDEYCIQVHDPYRAKSTNQLNRLSRSSTHYYEEQDDLDISSDKNEEDVFDSVEPEEIDEEVKNLRHKMSKSFEKRGKFYARSTGSNNSGGYEIPDPDYEGSTGGSSEDLPLPLPPILPPASDTSEDYSHSLSISASSASGPSPSPIPEVDEVHVRETPTKISETDRIKIEYALRGRKTEIFVADSLANLYYKTKMAQRPLSSGSNVTNSSSRSTSSEDQVEWILKYTGVPVLLLDTGETKSRDKRRIQIVLAELGSGLALWKDVIDHLSSYQVVENDGDSRDISTFHTMHMSTDHTKVVGLSFDNADTADKFAKQVDKLTSDFANISLSGSKQKNKKGGKNKDKKVVQKYVRPNKSEISQPCAFTHISSLSPKDKNLFSSLQHFVTGKNSKK